MSNKVYSVQCTRSRLQRLTRLGFGSVDSRILNQVIDNKHWQQARSKALHYIFPVVKGQYVFAGAQALRIPFKCLGASEKNPAYREVIMSNNHDVIHHLFGSLEDMLDSSSTCSISIHGGLPCGRDLKVKDIDLGVTGSPCNPYSTKRAKRFENGNVAHHCMNDTTQSSVLRFYETFEPKVGVTEQVQGFGMPVSTSSPTTPLQLQLVRTTITTMGG